MFKKRHSFIVAELFVMSPWGLLLKLGAALSQAGFARRYRSQGATPWVYVRAETNTAFTFLGASGAVAPYGLVEPLVPVKVVGILTERLSGFMRYRSILNGQLSRTRVTENFG